MSMTQSFTAQSRDGKTYTIHLIDEQNDRSDRSSRSRIDSHLPTLRTADGWHVSRIGKGRYQIIETGVTLESADPNAC
ncbi:MAG TPA: hypothetical protein VES89_12690 [Candidatus Competibacteraceae bacterium]|nr:hypothetical protein [Candidatus Competibacteraceae bacterium]